MESHEDIDKNCSICEGEVGDGDHAMGASGVGYGPIESA